MCFADLRQNLINEHQLLFFKVREADKKKNVFSALKKNQRDKKKLVETVLKQFRQLTSNSD
ncbi:exocyst complex component 6-like isoform X4 [Tachypleus tridentatus]|uniref:exocyst complex component 6-like isoform X4 n=1 Tax=Tachypleus tridentatus TaxID=6853 RepID=UPI003FCFF854